MGYFGVLSVLSVKQEEGLRRWSSMQAREFGPLHDTLATLVLNCDLSSFRTEGKLCLKYLGVFY